MADLHFDHHMWLNSLKFYKEELDIFENRLAEVSFRHNDVEVKANVERFQNQFIREKEVIDILKHDINAHENTLVEFAKEHPVAVEHVYFKNHTDLVDRMETFEKIWKQLRADFMNFLRNWM